MPARYVIERDLGNYRYRRYQMALDVEIPVADNPATAHLATYVRSGTPIAISPVHVTRYAHAAGLADAVRTVLRNMDAYAYSVVDIHGQWLWRLTGESQDLWLLWTSGQTLVKIGAPEGTTSVPPALVEAYLDLYPSDLDAKGHASK